MRNKKFALIITSFILFYLFLITSIGLAEIRLNLSKEDEILLIRDNFGVPHVYAKNIYGLYYGYGYAIATDRLFQMEMARRTVLGKVSEILGSGYINFDKAIRSNFSPSSIKKQLEKLPKKYKDIFNGYANGMNARIKEVLENPGTLLPKQFNDYDFLPAYWTPFDVAMIFVGTMCNRFGDFNTELDNLAFLEYLQEKYGEDEAWKIFNQTKWINDPGAPTTIMADDPSFTKKLNLSKLMKSSITKSKNLLSIKELDKEKINEKELLRKIGLEILAEPPLASNLWMINKKKTNDGMGSIIMNGPQFGWYVPGYVYEIGLHAPGIDIIGNTPFGYPVILFGHNKHIAWGSTAGLGDLIDIYEEKLNPENKYQYWFNGTWRDMEKRTETILVKGADPVTMDIYRTVHGFVVKFDEENNLAYSKRRSWEGFEIESLIGWIESTWAENFWQWRNAASKMALNVNWYYADRMGNIGYIYCGKYPLRKEDHDWRLPVSGKGDMEWLGFLPFEQNPQVYNPKRGYIVNWNNKPSPNWNDPDMWWLIWGSADRVKVIFDELEKKEKFTAEEIWEMNRRISHIDLNVAYFLPFLEKAVEGLDPNSPEARAVSLIKAWDRYRWDLDKDGNYDSPGQTIFEKWLSIMLKNTFADDLGPFFGRYSSTGYPSTPPSGSTNVQSGVKILYHALLGEDSTIPNDYDFFNGEDPKSIVLNSLIEAINILTAQFGSDMNNWLLPVVPQKFFYKNFAGIPQANQDEELTLPINMNRGTENHMVVLNPWGIKGVDVCPPGQSAFIAPDGTPDPHYADQMALYENFSSKPMLFYSKDVLKNMESFIRLRIK